MEVTRRGLLGLAGTAGALAASGPLRAAQTGASGRYAPVIDRVRAFAQADLAATGFPGMVLTLIAPDGFEHAMAVGLANADTRQPASAGQLFQIGSITKSLTALALFALADRGKIDLDARAADILPDHPLPAEPITIAHLLEHSSGLPNSLGDDPFPNVPGGRLWTGFAPGSRYSYCNLGYNLLGAAIARASGMSYPDALTRLVLRPLGMNHALPSIRTADRARYATGHARFRDDLPWLPGAKLAPRWYEFENGGGSVAATASDMARYLRFLATLAQGKGAPLFSDALAARFRRATIDVPGRTAGARYGNGLVTHDVDGGACFHHTGGLPGFTAAFTLDQASGVGAYASVNAGGIPYRPTEITDYAVSLLRAALAGRPLPPERGPTGPAPIKDAARFLGRWFGPEGAALEVVERSGGLAVSAGGVTRPLLGVGKVLTTDHPALNPYALAFDASRPLMRLGAKLFGRDSAPTQPAPDPRLALLAGNYLSSSSWSPRRDVVALGKQLFVGLDEVTEASDGSWRFMDPAGASERFWFQHPVAGRPQRLSHSGIAYARVAGA